MRIGKVLAITAAVVFAVPALVIAVWAYRVIDELFLSNSSGGTITQSAEDRGVFYRLVSKYQHNDEIIEFDVVVGCAVRVTNYAAGGSSYDAFRRPRVFAKATKDGGAVWQLIPNACEGETTENGKVPGDFLPGAVWFDSKDDFSFGIGYFGEDAFQSPSSKLKFLGAQIHAASAPEYQNFQPVLETNLFEPEALAVSGPRLSEEEARAILHDRSKLAEALRSSFGCHGYVRYRLSGEDARAVLREFWPTDRPRFWTVNGAAYEKLWHDLSGTNNADGLLLDGVLRKKHFLSFWEPRAKGFPTRAGGGVMKTGRSSIIAPTIFPLIAEDSVPGITPDTAASSTINRSVSTDPATARGFAYCFSRFSPSNLPGSLLIPNYSARTVIMLADGLAVDVNEPSVLGVREIPQFIYERDEFLYQHFQLGLE